MNGIIIKVKNIDIARDFYRDVLDLGNPIVDSNFWIEFKLGNFVLALELFEKYEEQEKDSNISFFYEIENLNIFKKKLTCNGHSDFFVEEEKLGITILKCKDPEGNIFAVKERK